MEKFFTILFVGMVAVGVVFLVAMAFQPPVQPAFSPPAKSLAAQTDSGLLLVNIGGATSPSRPEISHSSTSTQPSQFPPLSLSSNTTSVSAEKTIEIRTQSETPSTTLPETQNDLTTSTPVTSPTSSVSIGVPSMSTTTADMLNSNTTTTTASTTTSLLEFRVNADDSGADPEMISVPRGSRVTMTFNINRDTTLHGGIDFRAPSMDSGNILPGQLQTVSFIAQDSFSFIPYRADGKTEPYTIAVTVF
jgi:hypothetical protein